VRRRRLSLRARITIGSLAIVLAVLGVAGVVVIEVVERHMTSQIDDALLADADFTDRLMTQGSGLPIGEGPTDLYVQFVSPDGRVAAAGAAAVGRPALGGPTARSGPRIVTDSDPKLGQLRVLTVRAPTSDSLTLVLARSTANVEDVHRALVRLLAWLTGGVTVVLGALVWVVVGRALRPVEEMRRTVDAISTENLADRVDPPGTRDELDRLAGTLNGLLERLEAAVRREQQFVADASHELRTPITAIRSILETETGDPDSVVTSRSIALDELTGLQELVEELLVLASADGGAAAPAGPVDLDELVLAQASQMRRTTGLSIDTSQVSGGQVLGRDTDLGRLIQNLGANAARYATSTVAFTVRQTGSEVHLVVDDDGPGIAPEDRGRVFERFATGDPARSPERSGPGLGLAIASTIAAAHQGAIRAEDAPAGGARLVVTLPVFAPEPPGTGPEG